MSMNMTVGGMETGTRNRGDVSVIRDGAISNHYHSVTPITGYASYLYQSLPASLITFHNTSMN